VPAAYLHLAYSLASSTQGSAPSGRGLVAAGYAASAVFFVLALSTDLVVTGGISSGTFVQVNAGPLFWVYTVLLVASMLLLLRTIMQARQRALTPTLRRRLTYLMGTFAAPGLSVFPFLVIGESFLPQSVVLLTAALVSVALLVMMTLMAYSVAFQGVPLPDRLIKYDFTRWALYGPLIGVTLILLLQFIPWLERHLGLPGDTLITFAVMIMTVLMPLLVSRIRPYLDALVYRQDQAEITYLRELPRRAFTHADLRNLLENTLIAVCGALNTDTGFVAGMGRDGYTVKAMCGSRHAVKHFVAEHPLTELLSSLEKLPQPQNGLVSVSDASLAYSDFRLLPLRSPDGMFLGALGVADSPELEAHTANNGTGVLSAEVNHLLGVLTHQIELALTTVEMQQRLFDALRGLGPEMQSLQQLTTRLEQATPASLSTMESDISLQPQFSRLVKDALTHYWGGPKLSDSPLLGLRSVRRAIQEHGGNPTRALQAVLRQAITNLRPDEQLDPSAQEWLLYNILELRFLQGKRIRDIAQHLAMSESDFYRKQRIAVEEVARQLALMEDGEQTTEKPRS
jgi:hypothetical protein